MGVSVADATTAFQPFVEFHPFGNHEKIAYSASRQSNPFSLFGA